MSNTVRASEVLSKHTYDSDTYYMDFSQLIGSRTISTVDSVTASDSNLTIAADAVLASDTTVTDKDGNSVTLTANKAITFTLSGGTEQTEGPLYAEVTAKITLSDGSQKGLIGKLLIEE